MTPEQRVAHIPGTQFTPHASVDFAEGRSKTDLELEAKEKRGIDLKSNAQ